MAMGEGMKKGARVFRVSATSAVETESTFSNASPTSVTSSSTDLSDDASSPSSASCTSPVEADDQAFLVNQSPVRRGLSKFYQGKSQSYQSLSDVKSLEDLPKVIPFNGKMKQSRSYAGGFDGCNSRSSSSSSSPSRYGYANNIITNKGPPTSMRSSGASVHGSCKPPPVPAAPKNLVRFMHPSNLEDS